jgi:hypothetical protein
LHMNITTEAFAPFNSLEEKTLPLTVSGKRKSGSLVPNGNILDGVRAMQTEALSEGQLLLPRDIYWY